MEVEYIKDHGNHKKKDKATMHESTAKALAAHKIVKLPGAKVEDEKTEPKD